MHRPYRFRWILIISLTIITVATCVFGVIGYAAYGPTTHSVISEDLPSDAMNVVVMVTLCFSLFVTYAVQSFPVLGIAKRLVLLWDI